MSQPPVVSVVVASHARHLRLRWLLNALEDQTFTEPWELVIVHDYDAATAQRILTRHPLTESGRLRHLAIEPGTGSPSRQRNLGWREATGRLVAFTDDDCRPEPDWLAHLVSVAREQPGQIVQGATRPDALEEAVFAAPHVRTMFIEPVGPFAQTCNILYPRELLERLGGFDERAVAGEDVDLSLRARAMGASICAAPAGIVNHAIESHALPGILRQNLKWRHLAYLVKHHPELRADLFLRVFWDADHARVLAAAAGLVAAIRVRPSLTLTGPYLLHALHRRGAGRRARVVAIIEIPGQFVRQLAEVLGMAAGSVRHRTLLL